MMGNIGKIRIGISLQRTVQHFNFGRDPVALSAMLGHLIGHPTYFGVGIAIVLNASDECGCGCGCAVIDIVIIVVIDIIIIVVIVVVIDIAVIVVVIGLRFSEFQVIPLSVSLETAENVMLG